MYESTKTAFELKALAYAQSENEDISRLEAENLAGKMLLVVNVLGFDEEKFAKTAIEGMPAEQCEVCIQMFLVLMQKMSERHFDFRNEAAHALACDIAKNMAVADISEESLASIYAEMICVSHRTLQQSIVRLWVEMIKKINLQLKSYVFRSAAYVKQTDEILEYAEKHALPYI